MQAHQRSCARAASALARLRYARDEGRPHGGLRVIGVAEPGQVVALHQVDLQGSTSDQSVSQSDRPHPPLPPALKACCRPAAALRAGAVVQACWGATCHGPAARGTLVSLMWRVMTMRAWAADCRGSTRTTTAEASRLLRSRPAAEGPTETGPTAARGPIPSTPTGDAHFTLPIEICAEHSAVGLTSAAHGVIQVHRSEWNKH